MNSPVQSHPMVFRVLVVDDEEDNRDILVKMLGSYEQFEVAEASDGREAVRISGDFSPDVILMDMSMPVMDGLKAAVAIIHHDPSIQIILVTAYATENTYNSIGPESGIAGYIHKPFQLADILVNITAFAYTRRRWQKEIFEREENNKKLLCSLTENEKIRNTVERQRQNLMQSDKLAAVGQLAAGVAHEINNPLGFIKSNLETLKEYSQILVGLISEYETCRKALIDGDSSTALGVAECLGRNREEQDIAFIIEDLEIMLGESLEGALRVNEIVQNLKSFARIDQKGEEMADINQCLEATLKIAWNELKYKCEVIRDFSELPEIKCNSGQLNQVFLNLLVNASHSIEDKGKIFLRTKHEGDSIFIEIEDTGCGIPEDKLDKIFEPFFTTKEVGVGTGLGLAIAHSIIEEHGGRIEIKSEVGKGTAFRISLPVAGKDGQDGE